MLPRDGRELGAAGGIGQLPEAERIAHDDELGGLRADGDLPQELDQFVLEVATGESTVPADVKVADKVVGRRHAGATLPPDRSAGHRVSTWAGGCFWQRSQRVMGTEGEKRIL